MFRAIMRYYIGVRPAGAEDGPDVPPSVECQAGFLFRDGEGGGRWAGSRQRTQDIVVCSMARVEPEARGLNVRVNVACESPFSFPSPTSRLTIKEW